MKKSIVTMIMILIAVSCNKADLNGELFSDERVADDAPCFDTALLLRSATDMGRLSGVTYAKGICYDGSIALDDKRSFFTDAVIVNHIESRNMYASYLYNKVDGLYVKDESGLETKIGVIDTTIGEVSIKLAPGLKTQIALEQDAQGQRVPVLILEVRNSSQI